MDSSTDKGYEDSIEIIKKRVEDFKADIDKLDAVVPILGLPTVLPKKSEILDYIFLLQNIRGEILNKLCSQDKYK